MFKSPIHTSVISTAAKKGAKEVPTSLTVDFTGASEETIKALAVAQVKVRIQQKFRSDATAEKPTPIPSAYTVKVSELSVGNGGMTPEGMAAAVVANAPNDPKAAEALIKALQAALKKS